MTTAITKTTTRHAKHSPSALGYKEQCPSFRGRGGTNAAAEEGTLMHEALELDKYDHLTEEQAFLCGLCRDFRDGELAKLDAPKQYRELKLRIAGGLTFGTADFVAIAGKHAIVMDWKFGRTPVEPAATNAQGCAYALGVFEMFPELETLTLHFVQPRCEFITSHTFTRADVVTMRVRIETIIRRANARNREEHPGLQCCYCRKQATCAALRNLALPIAARYADIMIPEELHASQISDPAMMARCLDCAKVLKEWIESVNFHALDMALNGSEIPGYKVMSRAGRKTISDALAAYGAVKDDMTAEEFIECCGSVSIESLGNKVSANAPRGQKQKSKDELVSRLTEDGIITSGAASKYLKRQ